MKWEKQGEIFVPVEDEPTKILVFVDESYLQGETGKLQGAIAVSSRDYGQALHVGHRNELQLLGSGAKEFHGSRLSAGNKATYLRFIRSFIDHASALSDISDIRSIVSVDAAAPYNEGNFQWAVNQISGAFNNLAVLADVHLVEEFARQVLWLSNHLQYIVPTQYNNDLVIIFDNRHRFAQLCRHYQAIQVRNLPVYVLRETYKNLTSFANTLLANIKPEVRWPRIKELRTSWSQKECGLQASDVLVNAVHGALRYEMGIQGPVETLRHDFVQEFIPGPILSSSVCADLVRSGTGIECINPKLVSRICLDPLTPSKQFV